MSDGSEFHRSDAATVNERRPTVVSRNGNCYSVLNCGIFPKMPNFKAACSVL